MKTIPKAILAMALVAMATLNSCVTQKTQVTPVTYQPQQQSKPIPMILDSDFGSSTDDLFALMMLNHYIDEGKVDLRVWSWTARARKTPNWSMCSTPTMATPTSPLAWSATA